MMFSKKQSEPIFKPTLDSLEQRLLIRALTDLKEKQIKEDKSYDFIDSLIVKICDSEIKDSKRSYEQRF